MQVRGETPAVSKILPVLCVPGADKHPTDDSDIHCVSSHAVIEHLALLEYDATPLFAPYRSRSTEPITGLLVLDRMLISGVSADQIAEILPWCIPVVTICDNECSMLCLDRHSIIESECHEVFEQALPLNRPEEDCW